MGAWLKKSRRCAMVVESGGDFTSRRTSDLFWEIHEESTLEENLHVAKEIMQHGAHLRARTSRVHGYQKLKLGSLEETKMCASRRIHLEKRTLAEGMHSGAQLEAHERP